MLKHVYRSFIELSNHKFLSMLIKKFTTSKISRVFIPSYAKVYQIDQSEYEKSFKEYSSLQEYFIRQLKPGVRQINSDNQSVVSPVDGTVKSVGVINPSLEIVVKGQTYSIEEMLGNEDALRKYENGVFIILYLSPSNYHRIHSPISGKVISKWELGRASYPVNEIGLKYGKAPLSKNYRMISEIEHEGRHIAMIKVGALFINSIERTHVNEELVKGEEVGYFSFGSTVILLFEKNTFNPIDNLHNAKVKLGQSLGAFK